MKRFLLFTGLLILGVTSCAQDVAYARKMLHRLASDGFRGRGYVRNGNKKAADFIVKQLKKSAAVPVAGDFFQYFSYPMNTFPHKLKVKAGDEPLIPGEDFVVSCSSPTIEGIFPLKYLPDTAESVKTLLTAIGEEPDTNYLLVLPATYSKLYGKNLPFVKGAVLLTDKQPYWHVSNGGEVKRTVWLKIKKDALKEHPINITLDIKNRFIPRFETQNIAALIKGTREPDSLIVFSAHYDHLGMMGKQAIYHGANDNGSGTSMLLDLVRYYSKPENRPEYSVAFLFFSGEEAGLKGSTYFTEHPLFPLSSVKLLINLDMVGTGSDGITVVNGKVYPALFRSLQAMNEKKHYLKKVKSRGEACNSDHCPFYKKGVKSIFIYTLGKEHREYHIPEDDDSNFPFTAYDGLFRLLVSYVKTL